MQQRDRRMYLQNVNKEFADMRVSVQKARRRQRLTLHKWSIIRQRSVRIPCGNLPGCTQTGESQELKPITEMNSI